jgi:hypothetical protein
MDLVMMAKEVDPIKGVTNLAYELLGFGGLLILLIIVFKGLGLLSNLQVQALIGLIAIGLVLMLFTDGENSKELLDNWASWLMKYVKGEGP